MKKSLHILIIFIFLPLLLQSATRSDIKIIEASEDIRYLSQKIAKDYLFYYKYPEQYKVKKALITSLNDLAEDLRMIASATEDVDTKSILEFLSYSKGEISDMVSQEPNEENAALILDHSETLLEGADSIENMHTYDFSSEEKMIMLTKRFEYLMQRVLKYYIALNSGFKNPTNKNYFKESITKIEFNISELTKYQYPSDIKELQTNLISYWQTNREFLKNEDKIFIPKLMFISISYLEDIISKLELYHNKNQ